MKRPALHDGTRYRLGVAARTGAAVAGGYALTAAATGLLALLLPIPRADAVIVSTLASFLIYTCAVIWVFAAANAARAWTGMLLATGLLGGALALTRGLQ